MKILIAEDDPISCKLLENTLRKWGYEVVVTRNGEDAWRVLQGVDAPKLAILDWMMPGIDGVEVCRRVRQRRESTPYIYILLLTAKNRKEDLIEGLEAGADDYVTKPFDVHELKVRLRAARRILDLQEALLAAQEVLRIQATHDPLTGLWNRAAILDILERELGNALEKGTIVGVIMADLDNFKRVNDNYGHIGGDAVLREVARRIRTSVRPVDAIGRYGGEEFLIVLPECDESKALEIAEKIRTSIGERAMNTSEGMIPVTISIGVALSSEWRETEELIKAADRALYRAKMEGKNRVELAKEEEDIIAGGNQRRR
jgi:diguanylate cyclase (GGDEF)-like protein